MQKLDFKGTSSGSDSGDESYFDPAKRGKATHSSKVIAISPKKSFKLNEECLDDNKFVSNKSLSSVESTKLAQLAHD